MATNRCMYCMGEKEPGQRVCPHCGHDDSQLERTEYALPPGSVLHNGKYVVGRVLGQGGFGITYIGFDRELKMKVAIKEYYPRSMAARTTGSTSLYWQTNTQEQQKGRETFIKEARHMAQIQNAIDSVVRVQEIFYQNQTAYIIMNYIEGETLKEYLEKRGVLSWDECRKLLKPVMKALEQAHRNGMIHRDVSPDNIMIDRQGKVWLLDMGASKEVGDGQTAPNLSQSTHMVVRNGFSPLEQYTDSGQIGPWTDVYAVCATMYYCVTGKVVPDSPSRVYHPEISVPGGVSADVTSVLTRGLSLKPSERYQSMDELDKAVFGNVPPPPPPPPPPNPFLEWVKKHKAVSTVAALALACVALFAGWNIFRDKPIRPGPVSTAVTVETLGTTNSNMVNYGCWVILEDKYEYFIEGDNGLYVCAWDEEDQAFYVNSSQKVFDDAGYLTLGGNYVYFLGTENHTVNGIYRMNLDGSDITCLYSNTDGRYFQYLNYAKLSNGSEYLYFMLENGKDESLFSLFRYNLSSNKVESLVEGDLIWYNLHEDAIYYAKFISETRSTDFMTCGLDGTAQRVLVGNKIFYSGIIADGIIYMYSYTDETFLAYNLDGSRKEVDGFYNLQMDPNYRFCCEDGWIYYTSKEDKDIHRVRVNGSNDTAIGADGNTLTIYSCLRGIYIIEQIPTERHHQYRQQSRLMWLGEDGRVSETFGVGESKLVWKLSDAFTFDFDWTEDEDGDGVVITDYKGESTSFAIPETLGGKPVVRIGESAFKESDIQEIGLPEGVQTIDLQAFYGCESLEFVGLPDGLQEIGSGAFADCTSLETIDLPESVNEIDALAFAGTMLSSVYIPANVNSFGRGAFAVQSSAGLTEYTVSESSTFLESVDGVLYTKDRDSRTLVEYPPGRQGSYTIPDGTTRIFKSAFRWCKGLTELTIPESVTTIGEDAFRGTGLTEITVSSQCNVADDLGIENLTVNRYP